MQAIPQRNHKSRNVPSSRPDAGTRLTRPKLNSGETGAVSELLACADLLRRGYAAFRAVSPACRCDLVAMKDGQCWRVEVRTGSLLPNTRSLSVGVSDKDEFDVLAV